MPIKTCRFKGTPDKIFWWLKTGDIYHLKVEEKPVYFTDHLFGIKRPVIVDGLGVLNCPYQSWDTFYQNWEVINETNF